MEIQRAEVASKAEQARTANDNRTAQIMEFEAVKLDREPEPKIGHIAMALERRGERTARGDIWREVVDRNLDLFRDWLALQRTRLEILWERGRRAADRYRRLQEQDRSDAPYRPYDGTLSPYTEEQRARLLGRKPNESPSGDWPRRVIGTERKGERDDDRER